MHAKDPMPSNTSASQSRVDRSELPAGTPRDEDGVRQEERFFTHMITVLTVSSGMVGVCLTAIGLIGIMRALNRVETIVDDLLAVAAVLFMVASALSFVGIRTNLARSWRHFARTLDLVFCVGLLLVVVATILFAWVVL